MAANLEWITGDIRIGADIIQIGVIRAGKSFKVYGDKFDFVCTIVRTNDQGFIMGALGVFDRHTFRDIHAEVKACGMKRVTWERVRDAENKKVAVTI